MLENVNSNEQRATTRLGIMKMLACYEEILKEKERPLSCQNSVLSFFESPSGTCVSPLLLLDIGHDLPPVQEEVLPL